jgi:hypothetical protein
MQYEQEQTLELAQAQELEPEQELELAQAQELEQEQTLELEQDPEIHVPILSVTELENYKASAIEMRDRCVLGINDITMYRLLTHQYPAITRQVIADMEWWNSGIDIDTESDRYNKLMSVLRELPHSFSLVMSVHNIDCHQLRDEDILKIFFGDECEKWIYNPELVIGMSDDDKQFQFANYEYMASVVLNQTDELAFSITHLI